MNRQRVSFSQNDDTSNVLPVPELATYTSASTIDSTTTTSTTITSSRRTQLPSGYVPGNFDVICGRGKVSSFWFFLVLL